MDSKKWGHYRIGSKKDRLSKRGILDIILSLLYDLIGFLFRVLFLKFLKPSSKWKVKKGAYVSTHKLDYFLPKKGRLNKRKFSQVQQSFHKKSDCQSPHHWESCGWEYWSWNYLFFSLKAYDGLRSDSFSCLRYSHTVEKVAFFITKSRFKGWWFASWVSPLSP